MKYLKPWHTLLIGGLLGYAIARKTAVKLPIVG